MTNEQKERRKTMIQLRGQGKTYEQIASIFKISRQRVHQIIMDTGVELSTDTSIDLDKKTDSEYTK